MKIASDTSLEFLDLKLKIVEGEIRIDVLLNLPTVLATLHLAPVIVRKTNPIYLKV